MSRPVCRNRLLASLQPLDFSLIRPHLELVQFEAGDTLHVADSPISNVYFVEAGILAFISSIAPGRDVQVGMVGPEGLAGIAIVQGDTQSTLRTVVQITGSAVILNVDALRAALAQSPSIRALFGLYARIATIQLAATALANSQGRFEERLARWLLMIQDRSNQVSFTHDSLARMLGSSHSTVLVGLRMLEERGAIQAKRNEVDILDRGSLLETAGGLYGTPEREYERLLGPRPAA
jgi:CRP-like cAMP-binding protein